MSALPEQSIVIVRYTDDLPPRAWEEIGDKLVHAINLAGGYTGEELLELLAKQEMTAFLAVEMGASAADDRFLASLLTQVENWAQGRVLCVLAAGGRDFPAWAPQMQESLLEYAREEQCVAIRTLCRPGMAKWLRKLGWSRVLETMEFKDVR